MLIPWDNIIRWCFACYNLFDMIMQRMIRRRILLLKLYCEWALIVFWAGARPEHSGFIGCDAMRWWWRRRSISAVWFATKYRRRRVLAIRVTVHGSCWEPRNVCCERRRRESGGLEIYILELCKSILRFVNKKKNWKNHDQDMTSIASLLDYCVYAAVDPVRMSCTFWPCDGNADERQFAKVGDQSIDGKQQVWDDHLWVHLNDDFFCGIAFYLPA